MARVGCERAFVALGSNLGNRLVNLQQAVARLGELVTVRPLMLVLETAPLLARADAWPQAPYLNTVVEVTSDLTPEALLGELLAVERRMGRVRGAKWGPRVIDLDLVLFGERRLDTPALTLPHPGLLHRRFVLEPLAALAPELVIPGAGVTVRSALARLSRRR